MNAEVEVADGAETNALVEFRRTRPRSAELFDRATRSLAAGVTHNLRSIPPFPTYFTRGEGAYKWDVDDNRYVDYSLGSGSLILGHRPEVLQDLTRLLVGVPAASHEREIEWAELVQLLIPSAEKTRFVSSGTEATMLALRLARAYTGRTKVLCFPGHYHGWHDYALVGYRVPRQLATPGVPEELEPTMVVADEDAREQIHDLLRRDDVAAVIVEPTGAYWGSAPIADGLLEFLREETSRHGSVLIFDEVISGFRFSAGGVQAVTGITPDLTTLGKILAGGLPGGGVAGRADILDLLGAAPGDQVVHFGTFNGHPLAAALGVATLRELEGGAAHAAAEDHAAQLRTALAELLCSLSIRGCAYGEHSSFHVYLADAGDDSAPTNDVHEIGRARLLAMPRKLVDALHCELRLRGVDLMAYNGGVTSAVHGPAELELVVDAFAGAFRALRDADLVATC